MSDEAGFLQALREDPDDDAARLVYADWLEDQGDIRAEYLRLEYQLEHLPRRLAQLQEQIDPAWLVRVSRRRRVVLVSVLPGCMIAAIRLVREVTGMGLAQAKVLAEGAPVVVRKDLTPEEAEQLAGRFAGIAVVRVEPSIGA